MITTSSVLGQFDLCADRAAFPDLDNGYYHPVDARIHVLGDGTRWAVVAELLGYNPRGGNLIDVMHRFGNCLTRGEPGFGAFLDRVDNMAEIDPEGTEVYAGGAPVVVRGTALTVGADAAPRCRTCSACSPRRTRGFSWLTGRNSGRLPADLPVLLRLDEWNQPEDLWDTLPSAHETFRLIADVLNSSDAARYRPTLPPNTHWSHWPDAGTL
ncbi:DUF7003 family protein [Streptomyces kaempferi]